MSGNPKGDKVNKPMIRLSALVGPGNNKTQMPALVPPVLRQVGKLAAGVASVSTSSGSATGKRKNDNKLYS